LIVVLIPVLVLCLARRSSSLVSLAYLTVSIDHCYPLYLVVLMVVVLISPVDQVFLRLLQISYRLCTLA
jgi:uncharacterized integral membrane protein